MLFSLFPTITRVLSNFIFRLNCNCNYLFPILLFLSQKLNKCTRIAQRLNEFSSQDRKCQLLFTNYRQGKEIWLYNSISKQIFGPHSKDAPLQSRTHIFLNKSSPIMRMERSTMKKSYAKQNLVLSRSSEQTDLCKWRTVIVFLCDIQREQKKATQICLVTVFSTS